MLRIGLLKPISVLMSLIPPYSLSHFLYFAHPSSLFHSLTCALLQPMLNVWRVARISGEHCSLFHSCLLQRPEQGHSPSITRLLTGVGEAKRLRSFPQICKDIIKSTCSGSAQLEAFLSFSLISFHRNCKIMLTNKQ